MIAIYLLMVICVLVLARRSTPRTTKRRSAPGRKWQTWKIRTQLTLGTLANATALEVELLDNTQDIFVYSSNLTWSFANCTVGEGPRECVIGDGAYTVAQVIEAIAASPTSESDVIALERTKRKIRSIGQVAIDDAGPVMNDGKPVYRKLLMPIANDSALSAWCINRSDDPFTTGSSMEVIGTITGYWK